MDLLYIYIYISTIQINQLFPTSVNSSILVILLINLLVGNYIRPYMPNFISADNYLQQVKPHLISFYITNVKRIDKRRTSFLITFPISLYAYLHNRLIAISFIANYPCFVFGFATLEL